MKRVWCNIIILVISLLVSPLTSLGAKGWETIRQERYSEGRVVTRTSEIEVCTLPGTIMIYTTKPTQVRVFSILGQLVSSETIPAGVSQLNLGQHGLFIVKIGDLTCKVAL